MYAAWLLFVTTGMRRGEVAGFAWDDIDLHTGMLTVNWQLGILDSKPTFKPRPKSKAGARTMALDPSTVDALRERRRRQLEERIAAGPGLAGRTDRPPRYLADGARSPGRTAASSSPRGSPRGSGGTAWRQGTRRSGSRMCATPTLLWRLANATGWHEVKVISERLGHANVTITIDTYRHVLRRTRALPGQR